MAHSRWLAAAFVVPALTIAAACGGDAGTDADPSTAPSSAAPSDTAAASDAAASPDASAAGAAAGEIGCEAADGAVVGFSEPLPDPNFESIGAIIEAKLGEYNATLVRVNANLDPGKQIADIQSLIQSDVDVLIANPIDANSTIAAFDAAREADIPIVAQETTIGGPFLTNITADVESAATEGAAILAEAVGDGSVGAINGPEFVEVIRRENVAFAQAADAAGLTVADTQVNQTITPEAARAIADGWKQQFGADLAGFWAFNDTSAVAAASASDDTFDPVIVSINGQPEVIPLVESGAILATFDLQQDKLGQALAYAALAGICGTEVPEEIVIPVKEINADNVADWRPLTDRVDDPFDVRFEELDGRTFLVTE